MAAPDMQLPRSARFWATRALVLAAAIALGLALEQALSARLTEIQVLAKNDVIRARAELASLLRVGGVGFFGLIGALGVALIAAARRAIREERFPPPGMLSWGATRVFTGPLGRRIALTSLALAVALVVCSLAGAALVWHMAAVLVACKAP
jgi:hypothetical protein